MKVYEAPPNSLKDSNASPKVKTTQKEGVGLCSIVHNTLGVRRVSWNFGMGNRMSDKWVNYSYELVQTKQQVG
jgi:hypothetical protein